MGKTSLALNIAEHVALEAGLPVGIFSMEMSGTQLVMRMLGSVGRLDQHKVRTGRLADEDWRRLTDAVGKLNEAPIHIDETAALGDFVPVKDLAPSEEETPEGDDGDGESAESDPDLSHGILLLPDATNWARCHVQ